MKCDAVLELPSMPSLRALSISSAKTLVRLSALEAPRLRWVSLGLCIELHEVAINCPELVWLGIHSPCVPVRVTSECDCPLMDRGTAAVEADGQLRASTGDTLSDGV